jgi:hypothetical protein
MFKTEVEINRKDFLLANANYLKKYIGLREYILLALLLGASIFLVFAQIYWVFILFGVTVFIILFCLGLFMVVANKGYTVEFEKRRATKWEINFFGDTFSVKQFEGDKEYNENYKYTEIEKLLVRRAVVYVYCGTATAYYIKPNSFAEGDFISFIDFIKAKMNPLQLNMKMKRAKYLRKQRKNLV